MQIQMIPRLLFYHWQFSNKDAPPPSRYALQKPITDRVKGWIIKNLSFLTLYPRLTFNSLNSDIICSSSPLHSPDFYLICSSSPFTAQISIPSAQVQPFTAEISISSDQVHPFTAQILISSGRILPSHPKLRHKRQASTSWKEEGKVMCSKPPVQKLATFLWYISYGAATLRAFKRDSVY